MRGGGRLLRGNEKVRQIVAFGGSKQGCEQLSKIAATDDNVAAAESALESGFATGGNV
jgi:ABC-type molybdate transport system substrate-binding protein